MKNSKDKIKQLEISRSRFPWGKIDRSKIKIVKKYSGKTVLDVGCSSGDYVKYLNEHNFSAFGCDLLKDKNWIGPHKSRFKVANINKLPYPNNFVETILLFEVLEHIEDFDLAIKESQRVASRNLIISVPNCDEPESLKKSGLLNYHYIDRTHVNFFTKEKIANVITRNKLKIDFIQLNHPIMPEIVLLESWFIPIKIAEVIGKVFQRIPLNKKYYQEMLLVASK